ncbi:hypothetical protein [Sapientia aquatica]|uniref:Uncharacterized protein n=1 Tax=Sapientia aquatica TaxID=1549640 RepID=A0A4R5VVE5_9BURK|nr:hypothetical protein [Sapientia aquatica]TDK62714.1 hypothetical protein E2I14_15515 [Sapientia aquatica]
MNRTLIILFLILTTSCAYADEKLAKWEFDDPARKELGGRYFGTGTIYLDLIKCSIKVNLLTNEYVHYTFGKSGGLMLIHRIKTKAENYTKNLGLGCYTGKDLDDIKKDFTLADGSYGLSETFKKWGEENTAKIAVKFFKGVNWQGVGNVEYLYTSDHPGQYIDLCLFSDSTKPPQALCNAGPWNFTFKPKFKSDTFKYITDIFERITFIDHDQLPPDSPAIPPKPVEPSPAVPADSVQSE